MLYWFDGVLPSLTTLLCSVSAVTRWTETIASQSAGIYWLDFGSHRKCAVIHSPQAPFQSLMVKASTGNPTGLAARRNAGRKDDCSALTR